jgi:hypothetical protein
VGWRRCDGSQNKQVERYPHEDPCADLGIRDVVRLLGSDYINVRFRETFQFSIERSVIRKWFRFTSLRDVKMVREDLSVGDPRG